jgi:YVTN family beta-propeller protein
MNFMRSLVVVALVSAAACSRQPPASSENGSAATASAAVEGSAGQLFVTNEQSGDLSVIDLATERVVATVPLGKRPRGLTLSPDRSLLYVALSGSPIAGPGVDESKLPPPDKQADGIGIVDVKTRTLLKILPGGSDPEQVAVSADGKWLFVANEDVAQASVVDATTGKPLYTIKVGGEPEGVNVRPDGKVVYVTSEEDGEVFVIDAVKPTLITKFAVGPRPRSTAFLPDSSRAYVTSENSGTIAVIDAMKHRVLSTIQLTGDLIRPMGAVASEDGKFVFVSTGRGKRLVVIDTTTNEPTASIEVGERPWGLAVSSDGTRAYTANGPSNDISIVDVKGGAVHAKVKVGEGPWGVALID